MIIMQVNSISYSKNTKTANYRFCKGKDASLTTLYILIAPFYVVLWAADLYNKLANLLLNR